MKPFFEMDDEEFLTVFREDSSGYINGVHLARCVSIIDRLRAGHDEGCHKGVWIGNGVGGYLTSELHPCTCGHDALEESRKGE